MNTGKESSALELLQRIVHEFALYGEFIEAKPFGSGHINGTFVSIWNQAGTLVRYVHQRINEKAFHHPDEVIENMQRVTSHIRRKLELSGADDRSRRTIQLVPAKNGNLWVRDELGGWWRTYLFIEAVKTIEITDSPDQARILGCAVGKFQKQLADLPGPRLFESIPHFHDMVFRYHHFDEALEKDICNRTAAAAGEIRFMHENRERGETLIRKLLDRGIPERICHNDTKINNIFFNEQLTEGICVADLDTVMPGTILYDVGDMIRTVTTRAAEDETDLSLVRFDTVYFQALVEGYLSEAACFLTPEESELIAEAGRYMTQIMGLRFLTDYLEGDIYYKIGREGHNLDRCRNQIALIRDMDNQWNSIMKILENMRLRYARI